MDKNYALALPTANEFNNYVNTTLENNGITKHEWYELNNKYFTKMYLSSDNPRAQGGHSGDELHYIYSQLPTIEAIYKNGTFCDIGCATGHLMEMLYKWGNAIGFDLQMYGLDFSEEMIEVAKKRLPEWHDRFFVGNAFYWNPEHKFNYILVCAQVPADDKRKFYKQLLENYLADGGRMIIAPYWYDNEDTKEAQIIYEVGMQPAGYLVKSHYSKPNMFRKVVWFDKNF